MDYTVRPCNRVKVTRVSPTTKISKQMKYFEACASSQGSCLQFANRSHTDQVESQRIRMPETNAPNWQACQRSRGCMQLSAPGTLLPLSSFPSRRKFRVRGCASLFSDSEHNSEISAFFNSSRSHWMRSYLYVTSWYKG